MTNPAVNLPLQVNGNILLERDAVLAIASGDMNASIAVVNQFEKELAEWAGFKSSVCVSSNTATVSVLLGAMDARPGDEFIISPEVPAWVIAPLLHSGVNVVVADYHANSLCLCADSVERVISADTKALIISTPFGILDLSQDIFELARKYDFLLIIDVTGLQPFNLKDKCAVNNFDVGIMSLKEGESKLSVGEGGAIFFRDTKLSLKAKSYSQFSDLDGINLGVNHKISGVQCAVGRLRLKRINDLLKEKNNLVIIIGTKFRKESFYNLVSKNKRGVVNIVTKKNVPFELRSMSEQLPIINYPKSILYSTAPNALEMKKLWCVIHNI